MYGNKVYVILYYIRSFFFEKGKGHGITFKHLMRFFYLNLEQKKIQCYECYK